MARVDEPFAAAPLGSGERFAACVEKLRGRVGDPEAACAAIGRRAHGAARLAELAAAGRRRGAEHFGEEAEIVRGIADELSRIAPDRAASLRESADVLDEAEALAMEREAPSVDKIEARLADIETRLADVKV